MLPKLIVTAADRDFLFEKTPVMKAAIVSWIATYPGLKIRVFTDSSSSTQQEIQDLDSERIEIAPFSKWFHKKSYDFGDVVRFHSYTLQSERFMWVDPDCFALKPFTDKQVEDFDAYKFYGYSYLQTGLYNPLNFMHALSKSKLQDFYRNYGRIQPGYGTNPGWQLMDPEVGYLIGSEVLHYGYGTILEPRYTHNYLSEGLPIQVLERFKIPFKVFKEDVRTTFFHVDGAFDVRDEDVVKFWNILVKDRRCPTYSELKQVEQEFWKKQKIV